MEPYSKIAKIELDSLISHLNRLGYTVIGPKLDQSAIVYAEVHSSSELPKGVRDVQSPGKYQVTQSLNDNYFEFNVGPQSWKQFLFPPHVMMASSTRESNGWKFETRSEPEPKFAFLGVRACELHAIAIQDRVFMNGPYVDPVYKARRESLFIIAVNCTVAAETCFCTSMGTGPRCTQNFDIAITEIEDGFVLEVGSDRGRELLQCLASTEASANDIATASAMQSRAANQVTRTMDTTDIRNLLLENLDHPRWDDIANRCLSCANCTMVCPTCFCSVVHEVTDLKEDYVERWRQWDSCFALDFSYTASGVVRNDRRSRFRQWMTHKLASWHDQFDSSGCVGCGRCITWCPVGIDITEELTAIRQSPTTHRVLPIEQEAETVCVVPPQD